MKPPFLHTKFFSSLKQVEKRLKSEDNPPSPLLPPNFSSSSKPSTSTDHLSSPIYLNYNDQTPNHSSTHQDTDSEPPREFLFESPQFATTQKNPPPPEVGKHNPIVDEEEDDIKRLIELLGLFDFKEEEEKEQGKAELENLKRTSCFSHSDFYSKIVGVKGPKCEKEMERLDGWIKYYLSNNGGDEGQRMEPLRLVHLLLGKAACISEEGEGDFGDFVFPSTIDEFLATDPPNSECGV